MEVVEVEVIMVVDMVESMAGVAESVEEKMVVVLKAAKKVVVVMVDYLEAMKEEVVMVGMTEVKEVPVDAWVVVDTWVEVEMVMDYLVDKMEGVETVVYLVDKTEGAETVAYLEDLGSSEEVEFLVDSEEDMQVVKVVEAKVVVMTVALSSGNFQLFLDWLYLLYCLQLSDQ